LGADACHEITHIGDSGIGGWKRKSFDFTRVGRAQVKWREDCSRPSEEDRWQRSRDLANSGVRRVRAQVLGTRKSSEEREDCSERRTGGRDREISRTSSRVGSPSRIVGERRPFQDLGSARGIVYRDLARKDSRIWPRGSRDCEKRYPDSWRIVWAIARVGEWNTGGTKPSGSRREKSRSIGIRIRESRSAESRGSCGRVAEHKVGPAWSTGGHVLPGDRSQHSVEFSHLGDSRNRRVKARRFNLRGGEVARLRVVQSVRGRSQLSIDLSRLGGSQWEAQEFDSQTHEGASCERR
jgi:hypothetical protein